mgnify:CR=1 FL=1
MGGGGSIVDGSRRNSGARIRVLKREQIPACATPEEELIQVTFWNIFVLGFFFLEMK